jgi:hypothetical protein
MEDHEVAFAALERSFAGHGGRADLPHHPGQKHTIERVGVRFLVDVFHGRERMPEGVSFRSP